MVIEGLSILLMKAKDDRMIKGAKVSSGLFFTHILFVDDVLIFGDDSLPEWEFIKELVNNLSMASGMSLSLHKSCSSFNCSDVALTNQIHRLFSLKMSHIDNGLKYLGYFLKPNNYKKVGWNLLVVKIKGKWLVGLLDGCPLGGA